MTPSFFKMRGLFDFSSHPYDIGNLFIQTSYYTKNHVIKKIYDLTESDYLPFYNHHLTFYLQTNPESELLFFKNLWKIVTERIDHYRKSDPFSSKQKAAEQYLSKLEPFQSFLSSMDKWQTALPVEFLLREKNEEIHSLKQRILRLEQELEGIKEYDTREKIQINDSYLPTFVHLIHQMEELTLPTGNKLLVVPTRSSWYKMLARYYRKDKKDIPLETARKYFPSDSQDASIRSTDVKENKKLFKIVPIKQTR